MKFEVCKAGGTIYINKVNLYDAISLRRALETNFDAEVNLLISAGDTAEIQARGINGEKLGADETVGMYSRWLKGYFAGLSACGKEI